MATEKKIGGGVQTHAFIMTALALGLIVAVSNSQNDDLRSLWVAMLDSGNTWRVAGTAKTLISAHPFTESGPADPTKDAVLEALNASCGHSSLTDLGYMDENERYPLPPWIPTPGRYFLGVCDEFQLSNRLVCLERLIIVSSLLNRTLIVPQFDTCHRYADREYPLAVDLAHLDSCLRDGPPAGQAASGAPSDQRLPLRRVISLDEYLSQEGLTKLGVDLVMCITGKGVPDCPGCAWPPVLGPFPQNVSFPYRNLTMRGQWERVAADTKDVRVLHINTGFNLRVPNHTVWELSMRPMFATQCQLLVQPVPLVWAKAVEFARARLPPRYASIHLRRGDFKWLCEVHRPGRCVFWALEQAAECVADAVTPLGLRAVFVATNGNSSEVSRFGELLAQRGLEMVVYPSSAECGMECALVDQLLCANATQFISARASSFSARILQMREGMGKSTCLDGHLCWGRDRDFVPRPLPDPSSLELTK